VQALVNRHGASLPAWKKTAAWCRGNRGRWRVATTWSGSSSPDGSGLAKDGTLPQTDSPPPALPLTLFLDVTGSGLGGESPTG
jgi:hypothetical protein